tara:strand:- start:1937 stop:2968 length:1032 start_codon:yes stop_codon:yes gene_type:complete
MTGQNKKIYSLASIANEIGATLVGDPDFVIVGLCSLPQASPDRLSFLSNSAYKHYLKSTTAGAVIVTKDDQLLFSGNKLLTGNPYLAYALASRLFVDLSEVPSGIHSSAIIDSSASLAKGVFIGPNVVIEENVVIGQRCQIGAGAVIGAGAQLGDECSISENVVINKDVTLGNRVTIHSGAVIGADGFGYASDGEKSIKIYQLGSVRVGNDVEIGAQTTIDRGALDDTVICDGVKIDNQVQIGHNCHIGNHTIICGCVGLAGSVTLGAYCVMGGGSGAVGHITLADYVQVSAMSLVSQSISESGRYSAGTVQMKTGEWKRASMRFKELDSMAKRLKRLERTRS